MGGFKGTWARVAACVLGCGAAVLLLLWHADTLRLVPEGVGLAWPAVVAFGVGRLGREGWRTASGLVAGSLVGVVGWYGSQQLLPLTALAQAAGLATAAGVLAAVVLGTRGAVGAGGAAAGFGVGVAAAEQAGLGPTSGGTEMLAAWTALALSLLLGVVAASGTEWVAGVLGLRWLVVRPGREGARRAGVPAAGHEVFGPLLPPPEAATAGDGPGLRIPARRSRS